LSGRSWPFCDCRKEASCGAALLRIPAGQVFCGMMAATDPKEPDTESDAERLVLAMSRHIR
jgi:hypothetical protein